MSSPIRKGRSHSWLTQAAFSKHFSFSSTSKGDTSNSSRLLHSPLQADTREDRPLVPIPVTATYTLVTHSKGQAVRFEIHIHPFSKDNSKTSLFYNRSTNDIENKWKYILMPKTSLSSTSVIMERIICSPYFSSRSLSFCVFASTTNRIIQQQNIQAKHFTIKGDCW